MPLSESPQTLPADLEAIFSTHSDDAIALIEAFMPTLCNHVNADRIFIQARNSDIRVCKIMQWRRNDNIPWPVIPGSATDDWFVEDHWEEKDPLWNAALQLKPCIYIEDLHKAATEGVLNLEFETQYMFHTAFIHGHAHWPPLPLSTEQPDSEAEKRKFHGSVQLAVFDGSRVRSKDIRELVEYILLGSRLL